MGGGAVPVLETERLLLRGQRTEGVGRHLGMPEDPRVYRHLGNKPVPREDAWRRLLGGAGLWAVLGYGYWCVERKSDGAYIGQVGFGDFRRDMQPSIDNIPEMGWLLTPDAHGQGFASEAVAAGLRWIDDAHGRPEVVAIIAPENAGSVNVARKAGFTVCEDATYKGEPTLLLRRPSV